MAYSARMRALSWIIGLVLLAGVVWGVYERRQDRAQQREARAVQRGLDTQARAGEPLVATRIRLSESEAAYLVHVRPQSGSSFSDRYCLLFRADMGTSLQCWQAGLLAPADTGWPEIGEDVLKRD